jgi:ribosomal protein S18 acetylase RimI-like enzyme
VEPDPARCEVRPILGPASHPLRQAVLRPHQRLDDVVFPGDADPDTLHVGVFRGGALLAVATVCREAPPDHGPVGASARASWRLRGMATDPAERRRGHGRALVLACLEHVRRHGAALLWCHARVPALGFYRALGFEAKGEEFELPGIGPHVFMQRQP